MAAPVIESRWEHAHQCQTCGHVVRIDDIDAKIIATGIVTCQNCDASGPVNVKIVDSQNILGSNHRLRRER